jgi:hypothetical protein
MTTKRSRQSLTGNIRLRALAWLQSQHGQVTRQQLYAWLLRDISPEEACRWREHQATLGRVKRPAPSLMFKVNLGRTSLILLTIRALRKLFGPGA